MKTQNPKVRIPCSRCTGQGKIAEFHYVERGVCFRCRGKGVVEGSLQVRQGSLVIRHLNLGTLESFRNLPRKAKIERADTLLKVVSEIYGTKDLALVELVTLAFSSDAQLRARILHALYLRINTDEARLVVALTVFFGMVGNSEARLAA